MRIIEPSVVTKMIRNLRQLNILIPISLSLPSMLATHSFQKSESQGRRDGSMVEKLKEIWSKDPAIHVGTAVCL